MTPDPRLDHIERRLDAMEHDISFFYRGLLFYFFAPLVVGGVVWLLHHLAPL